MSQGGLIAHLMISNNLSRLSTACGSDMLLPMTATVPLGREDRKVRALPEGGSSTMGDIGIAQVPLRSLDAWSLLCVIVSDTNNTKYKLTRPRV